MTLRHFALSILLVVTACDTPTGARPDAAYDPTTLTGGLLYRWHSGTTIRVWTVSSAAGTSMDLGLAVRQAIVRWNAVPQFAEFTLTAATSIRDASVVVYDAENAAPVSPGSCQFDPRSSAGYTYFCPGGGAPRQAERLAVANGGGGVVTVVIRVDRGRASSQSTYNAIVAHEFGHALGIGAHSDVSTDLMFGLPAVERPSIRDIATLRAVLGRPPGLTL